MCKCAAVTARNLLLSRGCVGTQTHRHTHTHYYDSCYLDVACRCFSPYFPCCVYDTFMCRQGFLSSSAGMDHAGLRLQIQHTLLYSPWQPILCEHQHFSGALLKCRNVHIYLFISSFHITMRTDSQY